MAGQQLSTGQRKSRLRRAAPWIGVAGLAVAGFALFGPGFAAVERVEPRPANAEPGEFRRYQSADAGADGFAVAADAAESEPQAWSSAPEPAPTSLAKLAPADPSASSASEFAEASAVSLDCIIEPSELVEVRSPVRGRIEKVLVERSEAVETGQVLVELESSVERAAVEVARARAEMTGEIDARAARLELGVAKQERANKLYRGDALSVDRRQEAETEAKVARLDLEHARENRQMAALELRRAVAAFERRTITSPIDGYVVDRLMSPGEVVDEETVLRLAQIDPLRVEVILPSALYGTIRPGARAAVVPENPGDRVHEASVTIVDPIVDAASSTFGVRLELPNPDHAIPAGLHCEVRFSSDS